MQFYLTAKVTYKGPSAPKTKSTQIEVPFAVPTATNSEERAVRKARKIASAIHNRFRQRPNYKLEARLYRCKRMYLVMSRRPGDPKLDWLKDAPD